MRILILNTDYPEFLGWLYHNNSAVESAPYEEQMRTRNQSLFGVADFYSRNLNALGHEARDLHVNNPWMQSAWAREAGMSVDDTGTSNLRDGLKQVRQTASRMGLGRLRFLFKPLLDSMDGRMDPVLEEILLAQTADFNPDIILNQAILEVPPEVITKLRSFTKLVVGQVASPLTDDVDLKGYDLMLSSMPHFVERFERAGVPARLHRFAFDPVVLESVGNESPRQGISFVGSLSAAHGQRIRLLTYLAERMDLRLWGQHIETLPANSPLHRCFQGPAWGRDMFRLLKHTLIALNHHIDIAGRYANNMRLFEATGVGAMLLTDAKENLADMFDPGGEVVTYGSMEECAERAIFYLEHREELGRIAEAGQQRTLNCHTYLARMGELTEVLEERLTAIA